MMKSIIKILFIGIVIYAFIFVAAYLFLLFQGKAIITRQLQELTHRKVNIDYLGLNLPLNLEIRNLKIEDQLRVDYVFISPSILWLLAGNIALNDLKLVRPQFVYERPQTITQESPVNTAIAAPAPELSPPPQAQLKTSAKKTQFPRLIFKHLSVKDGKVDFIDRIIGGEVIKITIKDIDFNLTNLYIYPRSMIANFELKGKVPWQQGQQEGRIEAEGWLNLFKKDMQATLKIEDIDGIYLYPYYSKWVDLGKARIEKAKLNFSSDIQSLNNNLTAECHLELTDIVFKPRTLEEQQEKAEKIAAVVLDIFRALNQGKIVLNFTVKTKMDRPEFGFGDIKMAFEDKLAQGMKTDRFSVDSILNLPAKLIQTTVKSATDISKAVIEGTVEVGKAVLGPFKKEKKE